MRTTDLRSRSYLHLFGLSVANRNEPFLQSVDEFPLHVELAHVGSASRTSATVEFRLML